jgi:hypothetical protein
MMIVKEKLHLWSNLLITGNYSVFLAVYQQSLIQGQKYVVSPAQEGVMCTTYFVEPSYALSL